MLLTINHGEEKVCRDVVLRELTVRRSFFWHQVPQTAGGFMRDFNLWQKNFFRGFNSRVGARCCGSVIFYSDYLEQYYSSSRRLTFSYFFHQSRFPQASLKWHSKCVLTFSTADDVKQSVLVFAKIVDVLFICQFR